MREISWLSRHVDDIHWTHLVLIYASYVSYEESGSGLM